MNERATPRRGFSAEWAAVVLSLLLAVGTVLYYGGRMVQSIDDLTRRVTALECKLDPRGNADSCNLLACH